MAATVYRVTDLSRKDSSSSFRINVTPSAKGHRTSPPSAQNHSRHDKGQGPSAEADPCSEKEKQETETKEPIFFVRWVSNRPRLCFGVALGVHVFFLALSGVMVASGYDLFPANFETLPMELHDEPWLKRDYAWQDKDEYSNRVDRNLPSSKYPTWPRAFTKEGMLLFYYAGSGGNIFTKSSLQLMQTIEDRLVSVPEFSSYCQVTQAGSCTPPVSVLRFFDGTYVSVDPVFNDTNFDNIDAVLYAAYSMNETKSVFLFALGKANEVTSTSVSSTLTRTLVPLGWPLAGYSEEKAMQDVLTQFMADYMKPVLDSYLEVSQFEFVYYNNKLMYYEVQKQAVYDMALALGSMVFIFCFILFHTRSLWVTCLAELSIVCSFVETNFIYRVVIGFRYFGYFHVLAMFIILGIGADDLFVFWDAWKATGLQRFPSLAQRLNEAYRKSVISMLVTSLTTMTAFLANALSPLLATRSFGVFAAILIGIDYLSVITFFPTIIIFYHLHFEDKPHPCCCCWPKKSKEKEEVNTEVGDSFKYTNGNSPNGHPVPPSITTISGREKNSVITFHGGHTQTSFIHHNGTDTSPGHTSNLNDGTAEDEKSDDSSSSQKPNRLVIFFRDYYFAFVTHRIVRWVVVVVLLGCLVGFAISASRLEPDNEQIQLYTDSHYYTKAIRHNNYGFVENDMDRTITLYLIQLYTDSHYYTKAIRHNNYGFVENDMDRTITLYLVWGLRERDLSSCHFSAVECKGTQHFDDTFDASTQAAQQAFVTLCDTIFNFTAAEASEYAIRRDVVTGQLEVACFVRNMESFLSSDPVSSSVDVSMPWNWTETSSFMTYLNTYYNTSAFNSGFTRYLDIPMTYWIWDGFNQNNTEDYQIFNDLFGEQTDTYSTSILTDPSVTTGNRLKYVAIAVNTTLKLQNLGYTEGIPVVERWETFMQNQLKSMPTEMKGGFQVTILAWHWLYVQRALAENAVLGIAVGVSLAFPVLVFSTFNIINGLFATLAICCVTVCVIGVVPLGGWKLGVLVSLNMCLVVGLAVDFVVHLAEGYHMAHATDRKGRLQQSLERMGISVFSGACTTLGASMFMLFAKIQFFFQFGVFMFCTIGFSLLFSMGLYVTVMGIVGPQGNVGDIRVFFRKCCATVRPGKKNAVSESERHAEEHGSSTRTAVY